MEREKLVNKACKLPVNRLSWLLFLRILFLLLWLFLFSEMLSSNELDRINFLVILVVILFQLLVVVYFILYRREFILNDSKLLVRKRIWLFYVETQFDISEISNLQLMKNSSWLGNYFHYGFWFSGSRGLSFDYNGITYRFGLGYPESEVQRLFEFLSRVNRVE